MVKNIKKWGLSSFCAILLFVSQNALSQQQKTTIKQMTWGPDYQVYMQMDNDSAYKFAIEQLFHATSELAFSRKTEFVYFPVSFEQSYIDSLINSVAPEAEFTVDKPSAPAIRKVTLWGSVGQSIGGGWAHFLHCLIYVFETRQLDLESPLLTRPASTWKPKPLTDTYKRTMKWKYYAPIEQKQAQKEFKIRKKRGQLGDINNIPPQYVELMLKTSQRQYNKMLAKREYKSIAQINLVKLMLAAPYLGETQIEYIKSRVMQSISNYNLYHMPTVLIFEQYEAAVAMSLDGLGYKAEKIVYKEQEKLNNEEIYQRTQIINGIIALINESNSKSFKEKLDKLYKKE